MIRRFRRHPIRRRFAQAKQLVNYCETKVTTLPNGLRVATEDMGLPTTCVGLWIDCGTRYEKLEEMGTAHFFEHLVFKGSAKMSQHELSEYAEATGTLLNAYTSREHTSYYFQGRRDNTEKLVEILADVIQKPDLSRSAIAIERRVISAEYDDILANYEEVLFDYIHAFCFGGVDGHFTDSSLSYNILGTRFHISNAITKDVIQNFIKTHYHPSRMVLVGTGGVNHAQVVDFAGKYFDDWGPYIGPGTPTFEREATLPSGRTDHYANFWGADTPFHSCEIRHHKPGSDTLVGCVTYPICGWSHSDCLTMNLIAKLIGVFMHGSGGFQFFTSPFVKKMQALDQSSTFKAYMSLYNDKGLFGFIFTAFELDKASAIVDAFHEELERIATALSDEELSNAKRSLFTDICLGIDGTQPVADEIGRHLLVYNRRIHYPETEYLIENISREDVKRCVTQIIDSKEKCIALLGNLDHTPPVFPDVPQINDPEKVHEEAFCKNIITARK